MTEGLDAAVDRLTSGQIACLILVQQNLTSKEIAPRLGISPHTVDQRIRMALRILGCKRRADAAQLVAFRLAPEALFQWRSSQAEPFVDSQAPPFRIVGSPYFPFPFATRQHPRNEMNVPLRLLWIVVIACGAALSVGIYLAGLESLARLIQGP